MAIESVKNPEDEELIRKWQADYFEEKVKESEEKRAKKFSGGGRGGKRPGRRD